MNKEKDKIIEEEIDYSKIEYTREWFEKNQAHTILDIEDFKISSCDNIIHIGEHFLLDLYHNDELDDSEIWEVELTSQTYYDKRRKQWFCFKPIRKITTGKQFGYPNGYWKLKELLKSLEEK